MRRLCDFPAESTARIFGDAIYARGIENSVEAEEGCFAIWVHEDEQLDEARRHLDEFTADPAVFAADAARAAPLRAAEAARDRKRASRIITRERLGYDAAADRTVTPLFVFLALLSVAGAFLAGHFGMMPSAGGGAADDRMTGIREAWRDRLFISTPERLSDSQTKALWEEYRDRPENQDASEPSLEAGYWQLRDEEELALARTDPLPEVRRGEVWRLITPVFIHFGLIHLIFNLMWLFDFGSFIERYFSSRYLLLFVLVAGVLSNLPQYFWSGATFGGLSGVNYALFGFLWARARTDRTVAWRLRPAVVSQLMIWLVICMTGAIGPVGNAAHVAGLIIGVVWGGVSGKWRSRR